MAAPTQEYPPWLSPIPTTLLDLNGAPLTTVTDVVYLPLTYYGPSIPLGTYWVYGGLTSPPPSTDGANPTSPATPSISTTISTATPSTSSSATPSQSSSSVSLFSSPSLPSATSTSIPPSPTSTNTVDRHRLLGLIIGCICGFLFIVGVLGLIWLCRRGRRRPDSDSDFTSPSAVFHRDGRETDIGEGEGVPRQSGGEVDPLLHRGTPSRPSTSQAPRGGTTAPPRAVSRVPVPGSNNDNSLSSNSTSGTRQSEYGVVIDRPTLNLSPSTRAEIEESRRGYILTPEEMERLAVAEPEKPPEGALQPPRRVDPRQQSHSEPSSSKQPKHHSSQSSFNPYSDADEPATLLTARRVRVESQPALSTSWLPLSIRRPEKRHGSGFFDSLRRLSWFNKNPESVSGRRRSFPIRGDDAEIGKSLLERPETSEKLESEKEKGQFDRPISTVSHRSGATVFFDAASSLPSTPVNPARTPTPLPCAMTPSGAGPSHSHSFSGAWLSNRVVPTSAAPPEYNPTPDSNQNEDRGPPAEYDILDMPAPGPVTQFMTAPSIPSLQTNSATTASATASLATYPLPPGLAFAPSKIWTDSSSEYALPGSFAIAGTGKRPVPSVDILEQAPPSPGDSWRHLAEGAALVKRKTFGQVGELGQIPDIPSEENSLYSMRSPFVPGTRSTGSAPASQRYPSVGSSGSHRTVAASLVHSSSISSDAHRRGRPLSPAYSAFGGRLGSSATSPPVPSMLLAPPSAHFEPERPGAAQRNPSLESEISSPLSPMLQFSNTPWAGGLDNNWSPS